MAINLLYNTSDQPLRNVLGRYLYFGDIPQLEAPENLSVSGTTIEWDEVDNATEYLIYVDGVAYVSVE